MLPHRQYKPNQAAAWLLLCLGCTLPLAGAGDRIGNFSRNPALLSERPLPPPRANSDSNVVPQPEGRAPGAGQNVNKAGTKKGEETAAPSDAKPGSGGWSRSLGRSAAETPPASVANGAKADTGPEIEPDRRAAPESEPEVPAIPPPPTTPEGVEQ